MRPHPVCVGMVSSESSPFSWPSGQACLRSQSPPHRAVVLTSGHVPASSTWCDPFSSRWAWVSCPSPSPQQAVGIQQSRFTLGSAVDPSPVSIYNPGTRGQIASRVAPNREGPSTASLSLPVTRWLHGLGSPCRKDAIRC